MQGTTVRSILTTGLILIPVLFSPALESYGAEGEDIRLLRLHYRNSGGEKGVTVFAYDGEGGPSRALWQLLDGSRSSINFYDYDSAGRLTRKYREFSDDKTSVQEFQYDERGFLERETYSRSDGTRGRTRYTSDSEGRLQAIHCENHRGWFTGTIHLRYEGKRKIAAEIRKKDRGVGRIEYRYDSSGRLTKETWTFDGGWSQTFSREYDRYAPGPAPAYTSSSVFLVTSEQRYPVRESYDFNSKSGGPSEYEYIGDKLVQKTFTRSDGLKTATYYFYDGDHLLIKSLRVYAGGKSGIFTYTWNSSRRLVRRRFLRTDGIRASEKYDYDEEGRLARGVWENFDGWLTGRLNFRHDAAGRVQRGTFSGRGEKPFDARIVFSRNPSGDLEKIHWIFSFGKTQTYTFQYE